MTGQPPTEDQRPTEDNVADTDAFKSEIIDLGQLRLIEVDRIPNSVLRAAVQRVCAELAAGDEMTAFFQSSLRSRPATGAEAPQADGH